MDAVIPPLVSPFPFLPPPNISRRIPIRLKLRDQSNVTGTKEDWVVRHCRFEKKGRLRLDIGEDRIQKTEDS